MADVSSGAERRADRERLTFGRIVVIGGGCYGSWYTQQLARAHSRDAIAVQEIIVVDRNPECRVANELARDTFGSTPVRLHTGTWAEYLASWMAQPLDSLRHDTMVPSPLMPHLCLDWLVERAHARWPDRRVVVEPLPAVPAVPWERAAPDGRHYVSFATWTCPVNCIEPLRCPATRGPRDWSLPPSMRSFVEDQRGTLDHALIFHCEHRTYGVGMIDALDIARSARLLDDAADRASLRLLVGTVSHCHGALGVLSIT